MVWASHSSPLAPGFSRPLSRHCSALSSRSLPRSGSGSSIPRCHRPAQLSAGRWWSRRCSFISDSSSSVRRGPSGREFLVCRLPIEAKHRLPLTMSSPHGQVATTATTTKDRRILPSLPAGPIGTGQHRRTPDCAVAKAYDGTATPPGPGMGRRAIVRRSSNDPNGVSSSRLSRPGKLNSLKQMPGRAGSATNRRRNTHQGRIA